MGLIAHVSITVVAGHPNSNAAMHREQVLPERKMGLIVHVSFKVVAGHPASNTARHREQLVPEKNGLNSPCKFYSRGWSPCFQCCR